MKNKSGLFWAWLLTLPLLFFSATRNVNLILTTMRGDALSIIAGFFALFALDLGVLLWLAMLDKANSDEQSHIAVIMIVLDLAGAIVGMLADTLLVGADASVIGFVHFAALWIVPAVIAGNFVASIVYKLKDPMRLEDMDHRRMEREIERQRVASRLEMERATADAEIALERARVAQIRQNAALDMLNQAKAMASTPATKSPNGHTPDMAMLNADGQPPANTKIDIFKANRGPDGHDYGPTFAQLQEMARIFPDSMAAAELKMMAERGETMTEADRYYAGQVKSAATPTRKSGKSPKAE